MQTLVVNGEPVLYGDSYGPYEFRRFLHQATGEQDHAPREEESVQARIQCLIQQSYEEKRKRTPEFALWLSDSRFAFVAEDCCADGARRWELPTVTVHKKDRWGNAYFTQKQIGGCRCERCSDVNVHSARHYASEKLGVRFNV